MRIDEHLLQVPGEEGARAIALGLLGEAEERAAALARGAGEDPLHDFRVAVRRLRSALRALRPWLEDGVPRRHERRLKRIARSTNAFRDAEVQLAWLRSRRDALSEPRLRAGYERMVAELEARSEDAPETARVVRRFRSAARKLRRRLARRADAEPGAPLGAVLARLVREHLAALAGALARVRGAGDVGRIHRARIAGKRLRYLLEPLRGTAGADAGPAVRRLKRLQDVLGDLHDGHVLEAALGAALVAASAERAREALARLLGGGRWRAAPPRPGPGLRPGLVALARLARRRRDERFSELLGALAGGELDALAAGLSTLAAALAAPSSSRPRLSASTDGHGRSTRRPRPPRHLGRS